jgi:hypothetical protein
MYRRQTVKLSLFLLLAALVLVGCAPAAHTQNTSVSSAPGLAIVASTATPPPPATAVAEKQPELETPETIVRAFYDWYLAYFGDRSQGIVNNPLVDGAYRDTPYLTTSFVQHIDELLAEMRRQEAGGYDPILCAQDIPQFVEPDVTFSHNGMASVVLRSSFPNQMVTVDLVPHNESWLISNITCAHDPAGTAKAFYTWYLGTIGDRSTGDFRNPLVEQAYHGHPLLADSFVQYVDETVAGFSHGGYDPFLLAQDIPQDFSVDPGVLEGTAVVHLQFGPDSVKHLRVTLDEKGWRIADIAEDSGLANEAPVSGGGEAANGAASSTFDSDEYHFSFTYPASWILQELTLNGAGQPDDWPVLATWLLMPPEVAEQLANQNGPPDPNAPVIVAPFNIELVVGDQEALARVYGDLNGETAVFNNHEATILNREPGYTHVVFAHPYRPETWIVFTDWVTIFPGREAQGQAAGPSWEPLLNSLGFNE